ncbi:MAG: 1-acyl-sn-glycerol-3-phosphate acyltransferase [Firmicutes bacterium]|nr:1-acyl-sn-glycerol-3-phosphate acyltransferase [Bacillota bacterium]
MFYWITKYAAFVYIKMVYGLKVTGSENVPKEGGVIICSNHMSNFDPLVVVCCVKRMICYFAKKELFDTKWKNFWMRHLKAFPADRSITDMTALKTGIKILKDGGALGIFAQGTRVKKGEKVDAKNGVALFAVKGNACIVPVGINADYSKKRTPVRVNIGKPIYVEKNGKGAVKSEELTKITENVMKEIEILMEK